MYPYTDTKSKVAKKAVDNKMLAINNSAISTTQQKEDSWLICLQWTYTANLHALYFRVTRPSTYVRTRQVYDAYAIRTGP